MTAWNKIENESAKAYQAFCDYRDMGVSRSLDALHKRYIKHPSNKRVTKSRATINTWSARNDWQKRVEAWDTQTATSQTESKLDAIQTLLDAELRDYKLQLDKWTDAYRRTPLHERNHREMDDKGNVTEFIKLNHDDLHQMAKWRDDIAKQGRRALGLPDRITEKNIDHTSKGEKIGSLTDAERFARLEALKGLADDTP